MRLERVAPEFSTLPASTTRPRSKLALLRTPFTCGHRWPMRSVPASAIRQRRPTRRVATFTTTALCERLLAITMRSRRAGAIEPRATRNPAHGRMVTIESSRALCARALCMRAAARTGAALAIWSAAIHSLRWPKLPFLNVPPDGGVFGVIEFAVLVGVVFFQEHFATHLRVRPAGAVAILW